MNADTQPLHKRAIAIKLFCVYLLATAIFPPFHKATPGGASIGDGFGFIFADHGIARIDITSLAAIWLCGVVAVTVILYWLEPGAISQFLRSKHDIKHASKDHFSEQISKAEYQIEALHIELKGLQNKVDVLCGNQKSLF